MNESWVFSSSSQKYLQRCLEFQCPANDTKNKWIQKFRRKIQDDEKPEKRKRKHSVEQDIVESPKDYTTLIEALEQEPSNGLLFIVEESERNCDILVVLAQKISNQSIQKICHEFLNKKDFSDKFCLNFYKYFIFTCVKTNNSRFSLDLLTRSHDVYPNFFKIMLIQIFKDVSVSNTLIHDFIVSRITEQQSEIFRILLNTDLNEKQTAHYMYSIYYLYKDCNKTITIQNNMLCITLKISGICSDDKNYGRLLLCYLQAQKNIACKTDFNLIEKLLSMHRSAFQRPCLKLLEDMKQNYIVEDINSESI